MPFEKSYTLKALEIWFQSYRKQWWDVFSKTEQEQGKLLLERGLSSIEIDPQYLLVSGKKDQKTCFAALDLPKQNSSALQVSSKMETFGRALLASGLLCLEKLFQDHLDTLSFSIQKQDTKSENEFEKLKSNPLSNSTTQLVFFKKDQTLAFEVSFKRGKQFEKLTSLKQSLKPHEREYLLSIMLQTQKHGFRWHKSCFVNSSLELLPSFVQNVLPKLSQKYFVEIPQTVYDLCRGLNNIQVQLSTNTTGHLLQHFLITSGEIEQELVQHSIKAKNHIYWSEQHGLIRCQENTLEWVQRSNDWKHRLNKKGEDLPAYMLLSLFNTHTISQKAKTWLQTLQQTINPINTDFPLLRPYQCEGVVWLKHILDNHCHPLLADEMGLGKTRQLLTLLELLNNNSDDEKPSLVVCPASVISAWINEHNLYYPHLNLQVLNQDSLTTYGKKPNTIFVASYSQLLVNFHVLKKLPFKCVILDEAQCIKNPKSKTTHACFNLKAKYRIAATGTPVENNVIDLWTIFHFLMPGFLGNFKEFQKFTQTQEASVRLKKQIAPFVLRRTQEEVLQELPEKEECIIYCPMTEKQHELYKSTRDLHQNLQQGQWEGLLTLILRLRQICCDPGLLLTHKDFPIETSGKLAWLLKKLKEPIHKKIIIFSQFKQLLKRLEPSIKALYPQTYVLTGHTPTSKRAQLIANFQKTKDRAAFLISLRAGGTGITLHTADTLFILDPWWNPAVEEQAIARAHRLGQKQSLKVYRLLIEHSIEANIQQLQHHKQQLFSQLFHDTTRKLPSERWQQLYQLLIDEKCIHRLTIGKSQSFDDFIPTTNKHKEHQLKRQ